MGRIKYHVYVVVSSGVVLLGSPEWVHLKGRFIAVGVMLRVAGADLFLIMFVVIIGYFLFLIMLCFNIW